MANFIKNVYEHLITKHKYNKLQLRLDVVREELQLKTVELNMERQIFQKKQKIWENKLKEQEEKIIELKKRKVNK